MAGTSTAMVLGNRKVEDILREREEKIDELAAEGLSALEIKEEMKKWRRQKLIARYNISEEEARFRMRPKEWTPPAEGRQEANLFWIEGEEKINEPPPEPELVLAQKWRCDHDNLPATPRLLPAIRQRAINPPSPPGCKYIVKRQRMAVSNNDYRLREIKFLAADAIARKKEKLDDLRRIVRIQRHFRSGAYKTWRLARRESKIGMNKRLRPILEKTLARALRRSQGFKNFVNKIKAQLEARKKKARVAWLAILFITNWIRFMIWRRRRSATLEDMMPEVYKRAIACVCYVHTKEFLSLEQRNNVIKYLREEVEKGVDMKLRLQEYCISILCAFGPSDEAELYTPVVKEFLKLANWREFFFDEEIVEEGEAEGTDFDEEYILEKIHKDAITCMKELLRKKRLTEDNCTRACEWIKEDARGSTGNKMGLQQYCQYVAAKFGDSQDPGSYKKSVKRALKKMRGVGLAEPEKQAEILEAEVGGR